MTLCGGISIGIMREVRQAHIGKAGVYHQLTAKNGTSGMVLLKSGGRYESN